MAPALAAGRGALVFIGFMGAGKSTAARAAAAATGEEAIDTDARIERRAGTTIPELFERDGEAAFRALEEDVVLAALGAARAGQPVALGGGALGSARVRAALRDHTVVWLEIDEHAAWRRVRRSERPLARDREAFSALFAARQALYEAAADVFVPRGGARAVERALPALREVRTGMHLVWATTASGDHPVWVGEQAWPAARPGDVVISDDVVGPLHADRVPGGLRLAFPAGEEHKTLATAQRLWEAMAQGGITRAGRVIAVGGGVVGDVAGFVAAAYQRGIPVVHVPTTLVAQVDSAYGGKTGVDLPAAKNYVGAYHQPAAVHVVPSTLRTLPARERAAGYAEVVKTALIAGGPLWERVERGDDVDGAMVLACARTKLAVVAADERDAGRRQVLNLGHTVAHALESATGYAVLRHGEAVGLGLLAALRLSGHEALRERVRELLAAAGLPTTLPPVDVEQVVALTRRDKKRTGERVPFVLVQAPGDVRHGRPVEDRDLRAAVAELA